MTRQAGRIYEINLSITYDQMLRYYQGSANVVVTRSQCGTTLQFSAKHLRRYLNHSGVHGSFRLTLSSDNHLINIERIK